MKKLLVAATLLIPSIAGIGALAGATLSFAATRAAGHNGVATAPAPAKNDQFYGVQVGDPPARSLIVTGVVTALSDTALTIKADNTSQIGTFALNSSTLWAMQYKGLSYTIPLMVGMHVQIDWTAGSTNATRVIVLAS